MTESSRRHGPFDPRWNTNGLGPRPARLAAGEDGARSIETWEDEGGRHVTADTMQAPAGLDWHAFSGRYFPRARRHDPAALTAYGLYRTAGLAPGSPTRPQSEVDVARGRAHASASPPSERAAMYRPL